MVWRGAGSLGARRGLLHECLAIIFANKCVVVVVRDGGRLHRVALVCELVECGAAASATASVPYDGPHEDDKHNSAPDHERRRVNAATLFTLFTLFTLLASVRVWKCVDERSSRRDERSSRRDGCARLRIRGTAFGSLRAWSVGTCTSVVDYICRRTPLANCKGGFAPILGCAGAAHFPESRPLQLRQASLCRPRLFSRVQKISNA